MIINFSDRTPRYIREFAIFAARELGIDKLRGSIDFNYVYGELEESAFGLCWGDQREAEVRIATRQFGTAIARTDKLKTIAHELTHARQYLKRELCAEEETDNGPVSKWRGKLHPYQYEDERNTPWEVEAREMEEKIYTKWWNEEYK